MNKKILSLAVAAAFAVPMAAQAEVTVSGAVSNALFNTNESLAGTGGNPSGGLTGGDYGTSKLQFDAKSGDAFVRAAWDMRTSDDYPLTNPRENMMGVNLGGVTVTIGRQANAYNGGVKVDSMHATFLESRGNSGGVGKVASFNSGMLGVSGKSGDVSWALQYGPGYDATLGTDAPINAMAKFKAGPATVGLGYDSDTGGNASTGLSAAMKFGEIGVKVSAESTDAVNGATPGNAETTIFADVSMAMGGGTIGLGLGTNSDQSTTFTRLSYTTKVGGADLFAGVANHGSGTDTQRAGVGLTVKF